MFFPRLHFILLCIFHQQNRTILSLLVVGGLISMRKSNIILTLMASSLLLAGCGETTSVSTSPTSSSESTGTTTSSTSVASSSSVTDTASASTSTTSSSSTDWASVYGAFSITAASGTADAVYDSSAKTYTIHVAATKSKYTLVGYFAGEIIIDNANALTSFKGCQLTLNQAYLRNNSGPAIDYQVSDSNIEIVSKSASTNYIVSTDGNAITSKHNAEFDGKGTLTIHGSKHGVEAEDIKVYEAPTINVLDCGGDAFHGYNFYTDNSGSDSYAGTLTISGGEQAFDMSSGDGSETTPYADGNITINSGSTVAIDGTKSVFNAVTAITVAGSVTATNILFPTAAVTAYTTGALTLTVTGTFSVNGTAITSGTY